MWSTYDLFLAAALASVSLLGACRQEPQRVTVPTPRNGTVRDDCKRSNTAGEQASVTSVDDCAELSSTNAAIGRSAAYSAHLSELRRVYDSLRSCNRSSDCVLVQEECYAHMRNLGVASVAGVKAREQLVRHIESAPADEGLVVNRHGTACYRPICVSGRCEACLADECERCAVATEPPWLSLDRSCEKVASPPPP